ncbi:P-loop NTPase [Zongyangia hominis]|uniref:P-loop NTPase n=1 Tax=Zongyangia hominis TaxID=2763677 RepID=A0A926EBU2_9FIRM|nr:P-loop NTPase [Zongyangia hominis]MBC8569241.1 P-loop NTPase [Zongyangia hominis]
MSNNEKQLHIIVGHYGSGKTNFAVNLALELQKQGNQVALADMDIVNPYFRSADFTDMLTQKGIRVVTPPFANTNLDIPSVTAEIDALLELKDTHIILDIGGDDAGAAVLGRYSQKIKDRGDYEILYVINRSRYLTQEADDTVQVLREIEMASRLKGTGLVNNTHLSEETTPEIVENSFAYADAIAQKTGLPILYTAVRRDLLPKIDAKGRELFPVDIYVKTPWQNF